METIRKGLTQEEIASEINRLTRNGRTDEIIELVKGDYAFGLTKDEVNLYLSKQLEVAQMSMISKAIRECGVELATAIAEETYDKYRMQVAIDFCNKGVPTEAIKKALEQTENAHSLKATLTKVLEALQVDAEKESLKQQLEEKDKVIQSQQKTIKEASEEIQKLKDEKKELEAAVKSAEQKVKVQEEKKEEPEVTKAETPAPTPAPTPEIHYVVGVAGQNQSVMPLSLEQSGKSKQSGMYALLGKLAFKKKSRQDIVGMVASGRLNTAQLVQIKHAIERGLTEQQLVHLINSCVPPEQMKEIIEIAELENTLT